MTPQQSESYRVRATGLAAHTVFVLIATRAVVREPLSDTYF